MSFNWKGEYNPREAFFLFFYFVCFALLAQNNSWITSFIIVEISLFKLCFASSFANVISLHSVFFFVLPCTRWFLFRVNYFETSKQFPSIVVARIWDTWSLFIFFFMCVRLFMKNYLLNFWSLNGKTFSVKSISHKWKRWQTLFMNAFIRISTYQVIEKWEPALTMATVRKRKRK